MKRSHAIEPFIALLNRQAELIGELATYEGSLQEIVSQRDWNRLEQLLPEGEIREAPPTAKVHIAQGEEV